MYNCLQKRVGEYKLGSADNDYNVRGYGVEPIGGEVDQKLFYIRAAEPFTDTEVILLFLTNRVPPWLVTKQPRPGQLNYFTARHRPMRYQIF